MGEAKRKPKPVPLPPVEHDEEENMSGYRHSGMSEKDYRDRQVLIDALELIERRWDDARFTSPRVSIAVDVLRELSEGVGNAAS